MAALLVFVVFLVAIAVSIPIGTSMILGSISPILLMHRGGSLVQLINNTFSGANSTPILAVPLFILGGVIMAKGGISRKLFNFFAFFAGRLPGGLPCAVILTCLFYGAISGSGPATTAAVGAMCVPFLTDLGYDRTWSAGLIAVAGGLGVIIPPSIPFVLYSLATGVSTGDLFLGGVVPWSAYWRNAHGLCCLLLRETWRRQGKNQCSHGRTQKRRASETFQGQLLGTSLPGCRPGRYLQRFCNTDRSGYGFCFLRAFCFSLYL